MCMLLVLILVPKKLVNFICTILLSGKMVQKKVD